MGEARLKVARLKARLKLVRSKVRSKVRLKVVRLKVRKERLHVKFGERKHRGILCLREVLSMLVHCVYFRDLDILGTWAAWLCGYRNRRAESYGKEHWEHMDCTPFETDEAELKKLGLAFFLRKEPHPNTSAPRLAIVLRGTIPYKLRDLLPDLKIAAELLQEDKRFRRCRDLIWEVIQDFRNTHGGSNEMICIAGHSLGAAIALKVGIELKTRETSIDTHLFNPPMLTFASMLTWKFLPGKSSPIINTKDDADVVHRRKSSGVGALLQTALVNVLKPEVLSKEWNEFEKLNDWSPHFYLNPSDLICLQYLKYYRKRHGNATLANVVDPQVVITRLFGQKAKYLRNVVPSADLYISHKFKRNPLLAHSLKQWHKYTDTAIKLEKEQARLLAGGRHIAHETHELGNRIAHESHDIGSRFAHEAHELGSHFAHKAHALGSRLVHGRHRWLSSGS
jgi:hypothetical protein